MPAIRLALSALLLVACGSSHSSDSTAGGEPRGEPTDAGVPLGRPPQSVGDGGPELPPTVVKSSVLEPLRLTGNPRIEPDAGDSSPAGSGKSSVTAVAKLCIDVSGRVSTVKLLRSSGLPRYDEKIAREIKTWTYRPIVSEGQAVEVCTVMTFLHRSATPPPAPTPAPSSP